MLSQPAKLNSGITSAATLTMVVDVPPRRKARVNAAYLLTHQEGDPSDLNHCSGVGSVGVKESAPKTKLEEDAKTAPQSTGSMETRIPFSED